MIDSGSKFHIRTGADGIVRLTFESNRAEECRKFALLNNIKHISLTSGYYTASNLNPIMPLKDHVEGLIVHNGIDYTGLSEFQKLSFLGISDNGQNIVSLSGFPNLKELSYDFSPRFVGLETCSKLEKLSIHKFKSKNGDITALPVLNSLELLRVIKANICSLNGIERFNKLRTFELYYLPKLESILPLCALSKTLETIIIEKCKKIADYEILGRLSSLKKIILADSGQMESLAFVKKLPHLEFISFWGTNVLDGNIGHCEGIKYVGFDNKRHYSHKSEYFKNKEKNKE